jgi:hypothetical protein
MKRILLPFLFILLILLMSTAESRAQSAGNGTTIMFTAILTAQQEPSSPVSQASGTAWAILSADRKTLTYQVTYASLTSAFTASHFHLGLPGVNGGVIHPITYNGNTATGSWTNLPDSIVGALLNSKIYVNVHSVNNPGGEIRGQLWPTQGLGFSISLDADQVKTSTDTSMAAGTGWAVLNNAGALTYNLTVAGLTSSFKAAHFHAGSEGVNGGVEHPITFTDSSAGGTWTGISNSDLDSLIHNGLYVNVHTANYPAGEIRGQVWRQGLIGFNASLNGSQETPPTTSNASGTAYAWLDSNLTTLTYRLTYANLSAPFSGSHFHLGAFGVAGGVIEAITPNFIGTTAAGTWSNLPDSMVVHFIKGDIYLNVHSTANPGGEIRGQVWMNNGIGLTADLDGAQDTPPLAVGASGTAWLVFANDTLQFQVTFDGLSSKFAAAHFHYADAGVAGGVVHPLTFTDSTLSSSWTGIPDTLASGLVGSELYINVHTSNHPAGEIRGQVLPLGATVSIPTGVKDKPSTLPTKFALSQNYPNPFNPSTVISWQLAVGSKVKLKIYDILGNEVTTLVNEFQNAGVHFVSFSTQLAHKQLASGIYFYQLQAGDFTATKKMMLLK